MGRCFGRWVVVVALCVGAAPARAESPKEAAEHLGELIERLDVDPHAACEELWPYGLAYTELAKEFPEIGGLLYTFFNNAWETNERRWCMVAARVVPYKPLADDITQMVWGELTFDAASSLDIVTIMVTHTKQSKLLYERGTAPIDALASRLGARSQFVRGQAAVSLLELCNPDGIGPLEDAIAVEEDSFMLFVMQRARAQLITCVQMPALDLPSEAEIDELQDLISIDLVEDGPDELEPAGGCTTASGADLAGVTLVLLALGALRRRRAVVRS